ncbi:hypothetical protein R1A27_34835 (plasmid) [Methylobacterium sp. NMS12]|uniref:hypothetical protein n=1 Tax=Methylobacterium sp. NMS12 TaxID=3079766 RepID=UPI003F880600
MRGNWTPRSAGPRLILSVKYAEEPQQQDDRQRDPQQPKQSAFHHDSLRFLPTLPKDWAVAGVNARGVKAMLDISTKAGDGADQRRNASIQAFTGLTTNDTYAAHVRAQPPMGMSASSGRVAIKATT